VPANESITPEATAVGAVNPWSWKKRTLTAIRARFDGSATFMYPVASCIAYTGPNGIEVGTEPSVLTVWLSRGSCATTNANTIHAQDASPTVESTSPQSTPPAASRIVYAAKPNRAICTSARTLTRRSLASSGASAPTVSAASTRSSSTSIPACPSTFRSEVGRAADCRYGRSSATPSGPRASTAAPSARSPPTRAAVVIRS
jgi:hypothetical protein